MIQPSFDSGCQLGKKPFLTLTSCNSIVGRVQGFKYRHHLKAEENVREKNMLVTDVSRGNTICRAFEYIS